MTGNRTECVSQALIDCEKASAEAEAQVHWLKLNGGIVMNASHLFTFLLGAQIRSPSFGLWLTSNIRFLSSNSGLGLIMSPISRR
ncbi:unnamed protein product [Linum trigynum]|uniref:Uncharacterized protein n=1 Tax=Linum trigynum TaxID=586398 RepID=A0AAV2FHQ7_9ROSI